MTKNVFQQQKKLERICKTNKLEYIINSIFVY